MIDWNNIEDLKKLYNFTNYITGECPDDIIGVDSKCETNFEKFICVYCWQEALKEKIFELGGKCDMLNKDRQCTCRDIKKKPKTLNCMNCKFATFNKEE